MTSIQTTQNTITIQPLYKWDSEESQMTYLRRKSNDLFESVSKAIFFVSSQYDKKRILGECLLISSLPGKALTLQGLPR